MDASDRGDLAATHKREADDPVQQILREVIKRGWPDKRSDVPECVHPYFDIQDESTVQE